MKPHWVEEGGIYYGRVAGRHPQGPCHFNVLFPTFHFVVTCTKLYITYFNVFKTISYPKGVFGMILFLELAV